MPRLPRGRRTPSEAVPVSTEQRWNGIELRRYLDEIASLHRKVARDHEMIAKLQRELGSVRAERDSWRAKAEAR